MYDVFLSHASEDKARFANALVAALRARGVEVWYDSDAIRIGDDFRRKMDEGLAQARFGVVVLSPNFFKYWPQSEVSALLNQEATFGETRVLPIRLDLDHATLTRQSPLLATRAALGWELGVDMLAERIHARIRELPPVPGARSPVYNSPARRTQKLFGRDPDLARLDAMLVPGRNVRVAASIEGLAGVGKTELALHIVDRLSATDRFPGGIFWLDSENPDLSVAWGTTIADALAVAPGTVDERAASAVRIASTGAPVLVVLDNVERWTRESEPHPLPRGAQVALLVTTRHRFLAGPSFEHYALEVLSADAARAFLVSVAGRDLPDADDLLAYLDGHTLAIELAGAYLREFPSVTASAYLAKLQDGAPVEERVQDLVRYEATVNRALDVHWTHLDDTARAALLICACFAPEDASVALLEACGVDGEAQQPLRRFHLIRGDGERWRMHRLVRAWALGRAGEGAVEEAKRRFVEGCVAYSDRITLMDGFLVYRADGAHLEQSLRDAETISEISKRRLGLLHDRLASALQSIGDFRRAKELFERAVSISEDLGEHDPLLALAQADLAMVLKALGDLPRSRELLERSLASDIQNFGADHNRVAIRRSNLALVLKDLGELHRAKELMEQALATALRASAEIDSGTAQRMSNLATIHQEMGEYAAAKDLLERALSAQLENLDQRHPSVTITMSNLAIVLRALGDLPRAKDLLERALTADIQNLGEDHLSVAVQQFNLATLAHSMHDFERAAELFASALATHERVLGADSPATAYVRVGLAGLLVVIGQKENARAEAARALRAVADQPEGSSFRTRVERAAARLFTLP